MDRENMNNSSDNPAVIEQKREALRRRLLKDNRIVRHLPPHESPRSEAAAYLKVINSDIKPFRLHSGPNIIGREAAGSDADVRIPLGKNRKTSRRHLVIDIQTNLGEVVPYASLYKEEVNATWINNRRMTYGSKVILRDNDIITLPDVKILFRIQPNHDKFK